MGVTENLVELLGSEPQKALSPFARIRKCFEDKKEAKIRAAEEKKEAEDRADKVKRDPAGRIATDLDNSQVERVLKKDPYREESYLIVTAPHGN